MSSVPPRWFAIAISTTVSVLAAIVGFTASAGLTGSIVVAAVVGVISAGVAGIALRRLRWSPAASITAAAVPPKVRGLFAIGAALLIGQLLLAAAFIIDPNLARWNSAPWTPQRSNHSCVSSYWVACDRVRSARDIYAEEIYSLPQTDPSAPRVGRPLGPLIVDQYEYPPSFLVLPRLIAAVTGDFWVFRRVWFALNLAVVVAAVILVAARFDRVLATHALWLTPFVLLASSNIITLVMGNVQLAIVAMSMIAMLMFERQRHATGGVLLAYAVVSKLYPGLLLLYLLLRRDWRALAWTTVFAMAFVVVSIADFGAGPYRRILDAHAEAPERGGVSSLPQSHGHGDQRIDPRPGVQASLVRRTPYGVCCVESGRVDLHGRRDRAHSAPGVSTRRCGSRAARLDHHPDPRDDAEPVSADLRAVPVDVAGHAAGRGHLGTLARLHHDDHRLDRARVHVRHGRSAGPRERDLDLRAHRRCLRARRNRVSDGGKGAGSRGESIRRCHSGRVRHAARFRALLQISLIAREISEGILSYI